MKILYKIENMRFLLLVVSLVLLISCDDITTENNTTTATFNTLDELIQGRLPSLYASLRSNALYKQSGLSNTWGDAGVDSHSGTLFPAEYTPLYGYTYTEGTLLINETWTEFYAAIKQINTFLGQLDSFNEAGREASKASAAGEAKFLRAMLYFDMVKIWGDIPLVLNQSLSIDVVREDAILGNTPAAEVYLQIIKDLEEAIKDAPDFTESDTRDIASKEAAQVLLAKVYLQMTTPREYGGVEGGVDVNGNVVSVETRYAEAKELLDEIVQSGKFDLMPAYSDVFDIQNEGANTEVIFAIGFDGPNDQVGGDYGDLLGPIGDNKDGGAFGAYRINLDFALDFLIFDGLVFDNNQASDDLTRQRNSVFWQDVQSFNVAVRQLGPENFVTDTRFEQNVARIQAVVLANIIRGVSSTPIEEFNARHQPTGAWSPFKFIKPLPNPNNAGDGSIDFPYLRYADVLLMLAEIDNKLGDQNSAIENINLVRGRSFRENIITSIPTNVNFIEPTAEEEGTDIMQIDSARRTAFEAETEAEKNDRRQRFLLPDGLSENEIVDVLVKERLNEFCFETKRKDDLLRLGKIDQVISELHENSVNSSLADQTAIKASFNLERHSHWPIPLQQILLNPNLKQNCAYGSSIAGCF